MFVQTVVPSDAVIVITFSKLRMSRDVHSKRAQGGSKTCIFVDRIDGIQFLTAATS